VCPLEKCFCVRFNLFFCGRTGVRYSVCPFVRFGPILRIYKVCSVEELATRMLGTVCVLL
jgi:hypothetical protein